MLDYLIFEGCTIGNRLPFIEAASRKVFDKLGIRVSQAPFSCCPDVTGVKCFDNNAWLVLGARNLSIAEARGKDIITLCNGCVNTLRGVKYHLKNDSFKKDRINSELTKIGKVYSGTVDIKHFADVIREDIGTNKVKELISEDLSGLKVACHPGCHYMRPPEWMECDDPMRPKNLKELVEAIGATVVDYEGEALCCGSATGRFGFEEYGKQIIKKKLDNIKKSGADVICVHCPSCFQQFDTLQRELSKIYGINYAIPVLYLSELYALGMGFSADEIGLKFHRIRLKSLLESLNK